MATISHSATFSPVLDLVPEAVFFKVFISSFSVCYVKFYYGFNKFLHYRPLQTPWASYHLVQYSTSATDVGFLLTINLSKLDCCELAVNQLISFLNIMCPPVCVCRYSWFLLSI